ncbi:hypothetical protein [Streptomyces formicae]|uniref:Uncharacterized protein n=1 Tax=Streptomyces formicae TaxID=1616117 RepID=A0A291QEP2_9ACTN|nr:hypothetical protein [Streptomyces formicae]ATL29986.1 hypothetical protein KY5_4968 [Streptomyces formicae]
MDDEGRQVPRAAEMRGRARGFVAQVTSRNRLPLDFSVASLRVVDFLIEGLRKGGRERSEIAGALFGLGAYVGEVLVRRAGAMWIDLDKEQREFFGQSVGVRMPDGRVWNPLGKVVNCLERGGMDGSESSLQIFYLTLPGRVGHAA